MIDVTRIVPETTSLPSPAFAIFTAAHRVHRIWRWYRLAKIYSDPNNFLSLVCGHAFNFVAGDAKSVRLAALCLLVVVRVNEVIKQIGDLAESYRKLKSAWNNEYPLKRCSCYLRVKLLAIRSFDFLKDVFVLSMRMMDAIEMLYLNPETAEEGMNHIFYNGKVLINDIANNIPKLRSDLVNNREMIEKILDGINSKVTADDFIKATETSLKTVETVKSVVPEVKPSKLVEDLKLFAGNFITVYAEIKALIVKKPVDLTIARVFNPVGISVPGEPKKYPRYIPDKIVSSI